MKYSSASFNISPYSEAAGDVLAALLADIGFDTFVPAADGLTAYVQTSLLDEDALSAIVATFPMPDIAISYELAEAPDENWNATWEREHHFEPIHLPTGLSFSIEPRQAFGSGEHATTRMMIGLLSSLDVSGCMVIDAGCGTGVLSLAATFLGARHVLAYDIDEWSVRNALDNYRLNGLTPSPGEFSPTSEQLIAAYPVQIVQSDASCLAQCPPVDILLANINRNILLADMPAFVRCLKPGGSLLLSGFYETDVPLLTDKALELGLSLVGQKADGEWRALHFQRT